MGEAAGQRSIGVDELRSLVGHKFPGGSYTVAHWENFLLHRAVEAGPPFDGVVHPVGLFHVPLAACGLTFAEIFDLGRAESDEAVRAGEYTWELFEPLREGRSYEVTGEFTGVERKQGRRGGAFDKVTFELDLTDTVSSALVARVTNSWLFLRSAP
jgi:hypothetical protein